MARETVWIVAASRDYAEEAGRRVRHGHFTSYAAAEHHRLSLPLPQRSQVQCFDVEREASLAGIAARIAATAAGFAGLWFAVGIGSLT